MSDEIYEGDGIYVTRYCGPASEGEDRVRWQITIPSGVEYVQMDRLELHELIGVLARDSAWSASA